MEMLKISFRKWTNHLSIIFFMPLFASKYAKTSVFSKIPIDSWDLFFLDLLFLIQHFWILFFSFIFVKKYLWNVLVLDLIKTHYWNTIVTTQNSNFMWLPRVWLNIFVMTVKICNFEVFKNFSMKFTTI